MAPSRGLGTPPANSTRDNELTWHANAAANILEAQKRNGRVGGRKTRRGCMNCKQRHIKCDETPPACRNCVTSSRQCGGYGVKLAERAPKKSNALIGVQLSQNLGLQESERRTFDFFLSWTAPRLAGSFDKNFWCGQVLQVAQAEPVILDTLLAISKLYEYPQCLANAQAHSMGEEMPLPEESVGTSALGTGRPEIYTKNPSGYNDAALLSHQHELAVKHYNRAIARLIENVATGRATLVVALLSCVLFICVEILRDNVFAALNLFTKGYQILRQIEPSNGGVDQGLYITLKLAMTRLGVLAAMYGHPDLLEGRSMAGEISETAQFETISDARAALYVVMADSLAFHRAAIPWRRLLISKTTRRFEFLDAAPALNGVSGNAPSDLAQSPPLSIAEEWSTSQPATSTTDDDIASSEHSGIESDLASMQSPTAELPSDRCVPDVLVQQRAHFESRFLRWHQATESLTTKDEDAISCLVMYFHMSIVLMASRLSVYESVHDEYTHHYSEIVRLAEIYYKPRSEQCTFTFEPGAIPVLWMVATKCRVPSLRRRALSLMKRAPMKECMWARDSVAAFAARIIAIEEGISTTSTCPLDERFLTPPVFDESLPPESARIHDVEILKDSRSGECGMRVTRYLEVPHRTRIQSVQYYPM